MSFESGLSQLAVEKQPMAAPKYLTFGLASELYGFSIEQVLEILSMIDITPIPQTPEFFKGIVNLRGRIIPIIDLRVKFEVDANDTDAQTCIIVVEVSSETGLAPVGILVDEVKDVMEVPAENIQTSPGLDNLKIDYLAGIAWVDEKIITLLNTDGILTGEETAHIQSHSSLRTN